MSNVEGGDGGLTFLLVAMPWELEGFAVWSGATLWFSGRCLQGSERRAETMSSPAAGASQQGVAYCRGSCR